MLKSSPFVIREDPFLILVYRFVATFIQFVFRVEILSLSLFRTSKFSKIYDKVNINIGSDCQRKILSEMFINGIVSTCAILLSRFVFALFLVLSFLDEFSQRVPDGLAHSHQHSYFFLFYVGKDAILEIRFFPMYNIEKIKIF